LITGDEYPAHAAAIEGTFSEPITPAAKRGPGRPRIAPERRLPRRLSDATAHEHRGNNRVVAVGQRRVFGTRRSRPRCAESPPGVPLRQGPADP
jgi:hypothetical protein